MTRHDPSAVRAPRRAWGRVVAAAAALVALGGVTDAAVGQPSGPSEVPIPDGPVIDQPAPVDEAIDGFSTAVEVVHRNADLGTENLGDILDDPNAWVDHSGRIFIVEPSRPVADLGDDDAADTTGPAIAEGETAFAPGADDPVLAGTYPPSMAFELESRPGSPRVIYLDFDGHLVSGTGWNNSYTGGADFTAEPYDTDGNPSTFSDTERSVVQDVWRRVAEDFAPFDVNVTTKDPGEAAITRSSSGDQQYGTRVVISNTTTIYASCSCGGVAYLGVFDDFYYHSYYQPAWVFQRGVNTAKSIAEAASHEAGHNLGLGHDGGPTSGYYSGQGAWAPIMGVGYSQPITQWSSGEYTGATNTQDDLAVIQSNGLALLADDHGQTNAGATPLGGGAVDVDGIISTRSDVDVFSFATTGGTVSLTANPAQAAPNLDIALQLTRTDGTVLASADPPAARVNSSVASGLAASISVDVPAGTYLLRVDGVGVGDPLATGYSDYASLGRYRITGTIPSDGAPVAPSAVAEATTTSGTAPLPVTLDGSSSTDPDGTIVSYSWDLGDGAVETGAVVEHTYTAAGTFTATLTVTDDEGFESTAAVVIEVADEAEPDPAFDIVAVEVATSFDRSGVAATATVRVADDALDAASGVALTGVWQVTGVDGTRSIGSASGVTDATGTVTATSPKIADTRPGDVFSFCVTTVSPPPGTWFDPGLSSADTCAAAAHTRAAVTCAGELATIVGSGAIRGTSGRDVIVGGSGRDVIRGLGGDDLVCAGRGNDVVYGGGGDDALYGQGGRDRLVGQAGRDVLIGGGGFDRLVRDRFDRVVRAGRDRVIWR